MNETMTMPTPSPLLVAGWSDPLEDEVRGRVRAFIEEILEEELSAALGRGRYERAEEAVLGWRNGHRDRQVIGTFGAGRCACRGHGSCARMAGRRNGARRRCAATSG